MGRGSRDMDAMTQCGSNNNKSISSLSLSSTSGDRTATEMVDESAAQTDTEIPGHLSQSSTPRRTAPPRRPQHSV